MSRGCESGSEGYNTCRWRLTEIQTRGEERRSVNTLMREVNQPPGATPADRGTAAKPVQLATLAVLLPSMEAKPKFGRFVVLASYLKEAHARAAMKRGREFQPRMARVRVRGKLYYRVLSGPYARDAIGTMRRTLIGAGFPDAWTGTFCQDTLRLVPCRSAPPPLNVSTN